MNDVIEYENNLPVIADDSLLAVAEMAEKRIEAVIKIKQMALKVTNAGDWVDQNGKPYLMVSGAEKIANLFNISWQIEEPTVETEDSGHFTYTLKGTFRIPGRSISAEGSRSSKDPFFKKYNWVDGNKIEKPISDIDRRDVRMSALTNLLGNGITRLLGIRNLSYPDLEAFAGISKDMIGKIDYTPKGDKKPDFKKPEKKKPQEGSTTGNPISEPQCKRFYAISKGSGKSDDEIHGYLKETFGITSSKDIQRESYEAACEWAAERTPGAEG